MSFRLCFWPYDDAQLQEQSGTLSPEWANALLTDAKSQSLITTNDPAAHSLAEAILVSGFPRKHANEETDTEHDAARLLVRLFSVSLPGITSEFRYFDLLDHLATKMPSLAETLGIGRPWFGKTCPSESIYGTLYREDLSVLRDDADHQVDGELLSTFRAAVDRQCDLWFTI